MALEARTRLGPYELQAPLGAGRKRGGRVVKIFEALDNVEPAMITRSVKAAIC